MLRAHGLNRFGRAPGYKHEREAANADLKYERDISLRNLRFRRRRVIRHLRSIMLTEYRLWRGNSPWPGYPTKIMTATEALNLNSELERKFLSRDACGALWRWRVADWERMKEIMRSACKTLAEMHYDSHDQFHKCAVRFCHSRGIAIKPDQETDA